MIIRASLFLLLYISFINNSYSQSKGDSLKLVWENKNELDSIRFKAIDAYYDLYTYSQPDSTLIVTAYHYELAQEKNAVEQMVWALNHKGIIYFSKGDNDVAKDFYTKAATLANPLNNSVLTSTIQGNIGNVFSRQKNYQKATQHYAAALKVFQDQKNEKGEARMLNNLGAIYQVIGNYDLALEYYYKSLSIFEKNNVQNRKIGLLFLNIGSIQLLQEKYDEAIASFEKSLTIFQSVNEIIFEAICYNNIAEVYQKSGQANLAHTYAKKGLEKGSVLDQKWEVIQSLLIIAQVTFETNVDEATRQAEAILAQLPTGTSKKTKKDVYQLLYTCYKAQNKMSLSLEMYELNTLYRDSIQIEQSSFAVVREAVKNDFEVQLYENKLESERAQAALKLKQLKSNFFIIGVSILLIIGIVLYFRSKNIKNSKKRDALLEELESLKNAEKSNLLVNSTTFELNREKIQESIGRKLNETDWTVLTIILEDPVIPNKEIAEKAFMSVDGIGSSLRRMYDYFEIKETKYKKISLLTDSIKRSKSA
ncbi:MAG: tetratricopeptide (TPR) repeat protein [Dokdonia sp.]